MIQLIAMDMDGTLLTPPPSHITDNTVRILKKAADQGIHLALVSGRLVDDASQFAADAGLDMAVIGLNGSCMALHPFAPLSELHHFNRAQGKDILKSLLQVNAFFGMFCDHDLYVHEPDPDHPLPDMIWGTHLSSGRGKIYRDDAHGYLLSDRGISKFVVMDLHSAGFLDGLSARLQDLDPMPALSSSWKSNLEINPPGVTKGIALQKLCSMLSIPMEHVMAIGDNSNDLSMLDCAGYPVAMGNATSDILACARYRTLTNAEDGVAAAVSTLALHQNMKGVVCLEVSH